jgi:hypothetical protein
VTDLRLKYIGNAHFVAASHADYQAAVAEFKLGEELVARLTRRRSLRQNNYLHVIIQNAHDSRPEPDPRQPTWEHLKAHILNAVDHCDVKRFAPGSMTREVAETMRGAFYVEYFVDRKTCEIIQKTPRRTRSLTKEEMGALIDRVLNYICRKIVPGTNPEDLRRLAQEAARGGKAA